MPERVGCHSRTRTYSVTINSRVPIPGWAYGNTTWRKEWDLNPQRLLSRRLSRVMPYQLGYPSKVGGSGKTRTFKTRRPTGLQPAGVPIHQHSQNTAIQLSKNIWKVRQDSNLHGQGCNLSPSLSDTHPNFGGGDRTRTCNNWGQIPVQLPTMLRPYIVKAKKPS